MAKRTIDFTNVQESSGINPVRMEEGDYRAWIKSVRDVESKAGDPMWLFLIALEDRPSAVYPYYVKFEANQLWKLRNLLVAAGKNVPKKRVQVDPEGIVGKSIGVSLEDDEYEGKPKSVIGAVFPAAELAEAPSTPEAKAPPVEEEDDDELDLEDL